MAYLIAALPPEADQPLAGGQTMRPLHNLGPVSSRLSLAKNQRLAPSDQRLSSLFPQSSKKFLKKNFGIVFADTADHAHSVIQPVVTGNFI